MEEVAFVLWLVLYIAAPREARKLRSTLYRLARAAGNADPWASLDVQRIARRALNREVGRVFGRFAFGRGGLSRVLRRLLGA